MSSEIFKIYRFIAYSYLQVNNTLLRVYDKLLIMNKPLSCGAQDLLEAAIVQRRRLDLNCESPDGEKHCYIKVLPVDINSKEGVEMLSILTTDNDGGILKLNINTADIKKFEAKDYLDPRIKFKRHNS